MYVNTFGTSPRLHIRLTESMREQYSISFGEALVRYGKDLQKEYLDGAYRHAGQAFRRLLEEHFVVLNEQTRPKFVTPGKTGKQLSGHVALPGTSLGPAAQAETEKAKASSKAKKRKWKELKEASKVRRKAKASTGEKSKSKDRKSRKSERITE